MTPTKVPPIQTRSSPLPSKHGEAVARSADARLRALRVPLVSNALLVAAKLGVAILTGSISVLSEAAHSAVDFVITAMQVTFVRVAARPADADHAYGHGKFENFSAVLEAAFILGTAGFVVVQAIRRLQHPAEIAYLDLGVAVMAVSALVNLFVSSRLARASREEQSPALQAEAVQLRVDILTAAGVALTLVAIRVTGFAYLDPIVSLIVAGIIVKAAYDVSSKAFTDLMDTRLPAQQEAQIREIIERHGPIYRNYHKLRTRRAGGSEFIDFHLKMSGDLPLKRAHDMSDAIVVDIKKIMPRAHVLIHLEPED